MRVSCLSSFKVHIIHGGTMDNKGTQALLATDVSMVREITNDRALVSISAGDIKGVTEMNMRIDSVVPPFVDIPFQKVDTMAVKYNFHRNSLKYKVFAVGTFLFMFIQIILSAFSAALIKAGLKPIYRQKAFEKMKESDLVISCSGENFKETASSLAINFSWLLSWWSMLISRTWQILMAKFFHKPVLLFPNSIGPFKTIVAKFLTKLALGNCDLVLAREPISFNIAKSLGIKSEIVLTADTALLYKATDAQIKKNPQDKTIGVAPGVYGNSLSEKEMSFYVSGHAQALDDCIEKYGVKVVFLPNFVMGFSHDDLNMSKKIVTAMKHKEKTEIITNSTVESYKLKLEETDMLISSKMHPAILASTGYVPVLCIVYDHKQTGFFQRLNMIDCTLDVRLVTYERISKKIEYVWNNRELLHESLKKQIPLLQSNVQLNLRRAIYFYFKEKM